MLDLSYSFYFGTLLPATERWREASVEGCAVGATVVDCPEDSHFQEPSGWALTAANRSKQEQRVLNLIVAVSSKLSVE